MTEIQQAEIVWRDGCLPVSRRFGDSYFSAAGGLAEARHVFLAGNGLPERFFDGFRIAELGFGTGLNFLATALAWRQFGCSGRLYFSAFEAFPITAVDMERALSVFPELARDAAVLTAACKSGARSVELSHGVQLEIIKGDARKTVPAWNGFADAWFLDGFAPSMNPELWGGDLMRSVAVRTRPGGTCATYSAAGFVRRTLAEAGFRVTRLPGFARKRHMTAGVLKARP